MGVGAPAAGAELRASAIDCLHTGDLPKAEELLRKALKVAPDDLEALVMLSGVCGQEGRMEDCIQFCKQALSFDSRHVEANFNLGLALMRTGRYAEAREAFVRTISSAPDHDAAIEQFKLADMKASEGCKRSIRIHGGIRVSVPDSIQLQVPYVLTEMEDWFEEEIHFVRRLAAHIGSAIDVGANYGVYTLTLAHLSGGHCEVLAFEPAQETAAYLRESLVGNGLKNVRLIQAALSDHVGSARLSVSCNSEANSLVSDVGSGEYESVELTTLDMMLGQLGIADMDFVKLDAEGEEERVIVGGVRLFTDRSPLVMFEFKHGSATNSSLIGQFEEMGYVIYRLLPGLNILAPVANCDQLDKYQLNLFACKQDRASWLSQRKMLASPSSTGVDIASADIGQTSAYIETLKVDEPRRKLWHEWLRAAAGGSYFHILSDAISALDERSEPGESYALFSRALRNSRELVRKDARIAHLMTLARLETELGYRSDALDTLRRVVQICAQNNGMEIEEPFLPVSRRFEQMPVRGSFSDWCLGAALYSCEKLLLLSPYAAGKPRLPALEKLQALGYADGHLDRRYQLIQMRHGMQLAPLDFGYVRENEQYTMNPDYWGL